MAAALSGRYLCAAGTNAFAAASACGARAPIHFRHFASLTSSSITGSIGSNNGASTGSSATSTSCKSSRTTSTSSSSSHTSSSGSWTCAVEKHRVRLLSCRQKPQQLQHEHRQPLGKEPPQQQQQTSCGSRRHCHPQEQQQAQQRWQTQQQQRILQQLLWRQHLLRLHYLQQPHISRFSNYQQQQRGTCCPQSDDQWSQTEWAQEQGSINRKSSCSPCKRDCLFPTSLSTCFDISSHANLFSLYQSGYSSSTCSDNSPGSISNSKRRLSTSQFCCEGGLGRERDGRKVEGEPPQRSSKNSRSEHVQQLPEVLLLHVLLKRGSRGHTKGMRKKTKAEVLYEVQEAIGLARAASWQVVRGPSPPGTLSKWTQDRCFEEHVVKDTNTGEPDNEESDREEEHGEEDEKQADIFPKEDHRLAGPPRPQQALPWQQQQQHQQFVQRLEDARKEARAQGIGGVSRISSPPVSSSPSRQQQQPSQQQHLPRQQQPSQRQQQPSQQQQQPHPEQQSQQQQQQPQQSQQYEKRQRSVSTYSAVSGDPAKEFLRGVRTKETFPLCGSVSFTAASGAKSGPAKAASFAAAKGAVQGAAGEASRTSTDKERAADVLTVTSREQSEGRSTAAAARAMGEQEEEDVDKDGAEQQPEERKRRKDTRRAAPGRHLISILDKCSKGFREELFLSCSSKKSSAELALAEEGNLCEKNRRTPYMPSHKRLENIEAVATSAGNVQETQKHTGATAANASSSACFSSVLPSTSVDRYAAVQHSSDKHPREKAHEQQQEQQQEEPRRRRVLPEEGKQQGVPRERAQRQRRQHLGMEAPTQQEKARREQRRPATLQLDQQQQQKESRHSESGKEQQQATLMLLHRDQQQQQQQVVRSREPQGEGTATATGMERPHPRCWSEDEEALAESCVVVVREEHPTYLFGKGKLQEVLSSFSRRPTPFVFINCSSVYASVPLPSTLSSKCNEASTVSSSFNVASSSRVAAAARSAPARLTTSTTTEAEKEERRDADHSVLHGDYGYYYSSNKSVAGRLMCTSSNNERNSCGLRPLQQQFLQQAFEAALVAAAAAASDRLNPQQHHQLPQGQELPPHTRQQQREKAVLLSSHGMEEQEEQHVQDSHETQDKDDFIAEWLKKKKRVEVVDRQRVILEIFSHRAATNKSAMLQVAVARMAYLRSRLLCGSDVRLQQLLRLLCCREGVCVPTAQKAEWIGEVTQQYIASPNKSKADWERHHLSQLFKRLRQKAQQEALTRARQRSSSSLPRVAVVGYTNAGKTELMKRLCKGDFASADHLFCTLEIKKRTLTLPRGSQCLLMDSVGFIQGLPMSLCGAFNATLEEVLYADVLLLVVDISHDMWEQQRRVVLQTLYCLACSTREQQRIRAGFSEQQKQQQRRHLQQQLLQTPLHALQRLHQAAAETLSSPAGSSSSAATAGSSRLLKEAAAAADAEQAWEEIKLVEKMMGNRIQIVEVWNKVDLIQTTACMQTIAKLAPPNAVIISAKTLLGFDILIHVLEAALETSSKHRRMYRATVTFPVSAARGGFRYLHQQLRVEYDCGSSTCEKDIPRTDGAAEADLEPMFTEQQPQVTVSSLQETLQQPAEAVATPAVAGATPAVAGATPPTVVRSSSSPSASSLSHSCCFASSLTSSTACAHAAEAAMEYSTPVYIRATLQQLQQLKKRFPTCRLQIKTDPPALDKYARANDA